MRREIDDLKGRLKTKEKELMDSMQFVDRISMGISNGKENKNTQNVS